MLNSRIKTCLIVIVLYLAASLVMTYPLIAHFTTHNLGGSGDDMNLIWSLWWIKYALIDLGINPYETDYIFYPHTSSLAMHTSPIADSIMSIPFHYFFNLITIYNIFNLLAFVLSGFGVYLLARRYVDDAPSAFVGGLAYASWRAASTGALGANQWMPLYIYFLMETLDDEKKSLWYPLSAALMLSLALYSNYYFFVYLIIFTIIFLAYSIWTKKGQIVFYLKKTLFIVAISFALALPHIYFLLKEIISGNLGNPVAANIFSNDLLSFFSPSEYNPVLGGLSFSHLLAGQEKYAYVGILVAGLAVLGFTRFRKMEKDVRFLGIAFLLFTVLSLGPELVILGKNTGIPLPYTIFSHIPVLSNLRSPIRCFNASLIFISVFASMGAFALTQKRKGILLLVIPLIMLEFSTYPTSINQTNIPEIYNVIAKDKDTKSILELPFYVKNGIVDLPIPTGPRTVMYYQTRHKKKIFSGDLARTPFSVLSSYFNMPVFRTLMLAESRQNPNNYAGFNKLIETDRKLASRMVDLFGIGYVVVHKQYKDFNVDDAHYLITSLMKLNKIYEDKDIVVYKTTINKLTEYAVDFGDETSIPYLFQGWLNGQRESDKTIAWAIDDGATLLLTLKPGIGQRLLISARPVKGTEGQTVKVYLNQKHVTTLRLNEGWKPHEIPLPDGYVVDGLNRVYFNPSGSAKQETTPMNFDTCGVYVDLPAFMTGNKILAWEQVNERFFGKKVSFAVDHVAIRTGQAGKLDDQ